MKRLISSTVLLFGILAINGQELRHSANGESINYVEMQERMRSYESSHDLEKEKGWKWIKRWEQHYATRTNARGELVDPAVFLREAEKQVSLSRAADDADWLPVGPNVVPTPANGGVFHGISRINCVTFHPTDENTYWIGASQGGIWKTTDNGSSWTPLNDGLPILRISDIAVDPSNTNVMYACLGDFEYNGVALNLDDRKRHTHYGLGLYKSTDGGQNWSPTGLTVFQEDLDYSLMRRVLINPDNTSEVVVAGFEGLWKSTDGGVNWTNVMAGQLMCDLDADPDNPEVLYAASTYVSTLGEGTARVYKSTDFGDSWETLPSGIPSIGEVDRIELAVAPSNTSIVYALAVDIYGGMHSFHRSDNGGTTWTQVSDMFSPNILNWYGGSGSGGQGSYDLALAVDPEDAMRVFAGGINAWGSDDGGMTWDGVSYWIDYYGPSLHADQHQFKFNPLNNRLYVANDGGIIYTDDVQIGSWADADSEPNYNWPTEWVDVSSGMQITSFYRVGVFAGNGEYLLCGSQDNGTFYKNNLGEWTKIMGGDGMDCLIYPGDQDQVIGSSQYGNLMHGQNFGFWDVSQIAWSIQDFEAGEWTTPIYYEPTEDKIYAGYGNLWVADADSPSFWDQLSDFDVVPEWSYPAPASAIAGCKDDPSSIYFARRLWHSLDLESEMWVTFDGGNSWEDVTSGLPASLYFTDVVVDNVHGTMAWVTCGGFEDGMKVFQTTAG
ncbi:MAG: hypothetical protein KDC12_14600, partial [Flavobacteriales bacterium]|nr:hypothetical protein [Flavobacteriales bacterium]